MSAALPSYRARFPILAERSYFTAQCLGPLLEETFADLDEFRRTLTVRSRALEAWVMRMLEVTDLFEKVLGAPSGTVALRDSATACHAAIISALEPQGERRAIVTCQELHFRSSRYLWDAQLKRGFELVNVPAHGRPWLAADELCRTIDERTAVVALPLVSPVSGAMLPIAEVAAHARRMGAITVVDAYQALGIVPVDVETLGADVLIGGSHKWLCGGDMGLACMFVEGALAARLEPAYPGWIGHQNLREATPNFEPAAGAPKFQQGSPSMAPIYTARAGLRFLLEVSVEAMRARSLTLTARLIETLQTSGITVATPSEPERRGGMLCVNAPQPERIVEVLAAEGIDIDARSDAGLRIGPFPCLDDEECDRLAKRIIELVRDARRAS